jgi:hypothetical protein
VGPRSGLDDVEKRRIFPLPELELIPLGRQASSYTDCALPATISVDAIVREYMMETSVLYLAVFIALIVDASQI